MDSQDRAPSYKTIKRVQKNYLVRCNEALENIIPGNGVRPASLIRRLENEIKSKRKELSELAEQELLAQVEVGNHRKAKNHQELLQRRAELSERIEKLEKELVDLEIL